MANKFTKIFHLILATLLLVSCDTSRYIYRSSPSKSDYWNIKAFTLSHCGCTQLYIDHFAKGENDFRIFYSDNVVRKTIYSPGMNGKIKVIKVLLATPEDGSTTPFDPVDIEIFRQVDSIIYNKRDIIYPIKQTKYKGYINDPTH